MFRGGRFPPLGCFEVDVSRLTDVSRWTLPASRTFPASQCFEVDVSRLTDVSRWTLPASRTFPASRCFEVDVSRLADLSWFTFPASWTLFITLTIKFNRVSLFGFTLSFSSPDSLARRPGFCLKEKQKKKKKKSVCSWLFSFYLYFRAHTRCRVGLELVTGARGCIIHEEEPSRCSG